MARWATIKEAAEYMRMSEQTIYNAISRNKPLGSLFKLAPDCRRLADLDEVDAYLKGGSK